MTIALAVVVVALIAWTAINARIAVNIGKAHAALDQRAHLYDLEDADLTERRRLLDEAEAALARDKAQFAKMVKDANGYVDIALHNLQKQIDKPKLEVPGQ